MNNSNSEDFAMKKCALLLTALIFTLSLTSCQTASVKVTEFNTPKVTASGTELIAFAEADNYSWLLFNWIPLFSGNADRPNTGSYTIIFERSKATKRYSERMLKNLPQKKFKYQLVDLETTDRSVAYPTLFIFWFHHVRSTAYLKKVDQ
ncbi:MAG: hypothetical protein RR060_02290 [Victivallaceae bacterium]